jgi:hypothetical protein
MHFRMTTPCPKCPFRSDVRPYLRRDRAAEIADGLTRQQGSFSCHLTTHHDDEGEYVRGAEEQHCAGALIVLERMHRPNQMMRWMERLGMYRRDKLDMGAPVFSTMREFIAAQPTRKNMGKLQADE